MKHYSSIYFFVRWQNNFEKIKYCYCIYEINSYICIYILKQNDMKTYRLPYSNVDIDVNDSNIITRVSTIDFVTTILEMKLSDWAIEKIEIDSMPLWLDLFIYEIGTKLPENNEDFEKIVVDSWKDWCTENVLVGNQLDHYEFGEEWMAHDMIDYYGELRADGSLFQRRYDFTNADIEVRIKSEQNA